MPSYKVAPSPSTVSLNPTNIPNFVRGAPPSRDETVAEAEEELMSHIMRHADGSVKLRSTSVTSLSDVMLS